MAPKHDIRKPRVRRSPSAKRNFWMGVLSVVLVVGIAAAIFRPVPAEAQFGGIVADVGAGVQRVVRNVVDAARWIYDNTNKIIDKVSKKVGDVAFKNALRVFLGKIAEDTATWVASAGTGQKPLFITDGNYFEDLGKAAAGDYLDSLAQEQFGVSLCDPGTYKLQLDIAVRTNLDPNFCQTNCQKNYDAGKDAAPATGAAPATFNLSLNNARATRTTLQGWVQQGKNLTTSDRMLLGCPDPMTVAACLTSYDQAIAIAEEGLQTDLQKCLKVCKGQLPGVSVPGQDKRLASCSLSKIQENLKGASVSGSLVVTGAGGAQATVGTFAARADALQQAFKDGELPKIFNPAENPLGQFLSVSQAAQEAAAEKEQEEKDLIQFGLTLPLRSLISNKVKTPSSITSSAAEEGLSTQNAAESETTQTGSPLADAFGVFTKTLTSKLIDRIFNKGLVDDKGNPNTRFTSGTIGRVTGGVQAARERFASLSQVNLGSGGGVDILTDLSACPVDVASTSQTSIGVVSPNNCVLDSSFRQAIEERLTVKEALERGLLSDQKVFGFDANGREPDYRSGYPYRSLLILRKYRIIPVGWELAAEYVRDYEKQNVNIRTLVQQFDNPSSPYYRLIDPSWVLKAPENICLRTGYTEQIVAEEYVDDDGDEAGRTNIDYSKRYCNSDADANVAKECACDELALTGDKSVAACESTYDSDLVGSNIPRDKCTDVSGISNVASTCAFITPRVRQVQRLESCVDERSCILENDDGTCKQFGTCTEEEDIWRFNGQSCDPQYASCQTYTNSSGNQVSYVKNTLQTSLCNEDNAGCQQYCPSMNFGTGQWSCTATSPATRRYDNDVQSCDPSADGCTKLIRFASGTNLVQNASFEESSVLNVAGNATFSGWGIGANNQSCGAQAFVTAGAVGGQALRLQNLEACFAGDPRNYAYQLVQTGVPVIGKTFNFSFYARSEGASCTPSVHLRVRTTDPTDSDENTAGGFTVTPEWQRFTVTHTWSPAVDPAETAIAIFLRSTSACTVNYDAIQLEEGDLTDYKDYGTVNQVHLKLPPADAGYDLGCTGNPTTDPPACANYALKCSVGDVGCDLFTPLAGGQSIPAQPGQSCPADKVGCASFREQPTTGVLAQHATRTGRYCQNLMATEMRSCLVDADCGAAAPAGSCAPLVSFIGNTGQSCTAQDVGCEAYTNLDEVAQGGEGKAQFTRLQMCVPPDYTGALETYYSWVGDNESGYQLKQYRLVRSNLGAAPCTNLQSDLPLNCVDDATNVVDCSAEFGKNPDCAQYYDDGGTTHYRLRSRVIQQSNDCHPFRNEVDGRTYYADSQLSTTCAEAVVGCREYVGNTGSNTRTILTSNFELGSYAPWTLANAANPSTESVNYGGHSLSVSGPPSAQADLGVALQQGRSYTVQFWAKAAAGTVTLDAGLQATSSVSLGTATLTPEWNVYTLGPATVNFDVTGAQALTVSGSGDFYIDNVVLTELTDNLYRIKGSQTACGGFEGCQAYRNRNGEIANYQSFTKLCQADRVGCERLVNTRNSTTASSRTLAMPNLRGDVDGSGSIDRFDVEYLIAYLFAGGPPPFVVESADINGDGSVTIGDATAIGQYVEQGDASALSTNPYPNDSVATAADAIQYWVNDPAKSCQAADKGCRALGKQTLGMAKVSGVFQKSLLSTDTVYLKDDPDAYPSILCGKDALFCDAFSTSDGGTTYFRDPSNRTCSYREASGGTAGGWYLGTSNEQCPTSALKGIPPEVPTAGFAGSCPADQNGCGMYLDPLGTGESLTSNSDLEVGTTSPQGWTTAACSNDATRTCTQNSDCGGANTCNPGTGLLEYTDHGGSRAARVAITSSSRFRQSVVLQANTYYVVSAEVQRGNQGGVPSTGDVRIGVANCKDASGNGVKVPSPDVSVYADQQDAHLDMPADQFDVSSWRRVSARFFSGNAVTCQVYVGEASGTNGHWFDKLQLHTTTSSAILRQSVDSQSCNGQVGDKLGCRLFNDLSNTSLTYDADTSPVGGSPTDPDSTGSPATCGANNEMCDSNVLLKVRRDRQCSQWITPTTTVESTKTNGQKENLSVGLATCDSFSPSGQCNHYVDEMRCTNNPKQACVTSADCGAGGTCKLFTVTGDTPAPTPAYSREDLRNKSGFTLAGMSWSEGTLEGKYPLGSAPQTGADGITVSEDILNGSFTNQTTIAATGWTLGNATGTTGTLVTGSDGTKLELIIEETVRVGSTNATTRANEHIVTTPSPASTSQVVVRTDVDALANQLAPERTYMLAFDVRYLTQPDRNIPEPQTLVTAGISSENSVSVDNAWQGVVKPSTEWQRFVIGPLRLATTASREEGNVSTRAGGHFPFNRGTGFVFFATDVANRTPMAIDNVSLLPTLHVSDAEGATASGITGQSSGEAYISRSCRAYPSASALSCSYRDDTGKLFRGWQGYCLETDPKNPNTCLAWHPMDLLAGEQNLFGTVQAAGYSQRNPLYMCLESNGRGGMSFQRTEEHTEDDGAWWSFNMPSYPLNQVEGIRVYVSASDGDWYPHNGTVLYADRSGGQYACDASNCPAGSSAYTNGVSAEPWFVGGCGGQASREDRTCNMTPSWSGYSVAFSSGGCDDIDGSQDNTNLWGLRIDWPPDPDSTSVQGRFGMCDASGGSGHYKVDIHYIVRSMCTSIVQVVGPGGQNAAWSGRTASSTHVVQNLQYKQNQDALPFGSVIAPEVNQVDPSQWDTRNDAVEPGDQPLYIMSGTSDVRASTAYACAAGGNCRSRTCSANGDACNTIAQVTSCIAADGYCIEVGPAKTCQSGTRQGQACTSDADCGTTGTDLCDYGPTSVLGGGQFSTNRPASIGRDYLKSLFANVYGAWRYNTTTHRYQDVLATDPLFTTWTNAYSAMARCSTASQHSNPDPNISYCGLLPEVLNLSVGNTSDTEVVINDGENIQLRFNSYVDAEQLPLANIAIDWNGDATADQVIPWGFAPRSDPADPHVISHVYRVGADFAGDAGVGRCYDPNEGPYANLAAVQGHEYCVATPRVQIQDNWEWCSYTGTNGTLGRCRATFPVASVDYWTAYGGDIIVVR